MNGYVEEAEAPMPTLYIDETTAERAAGPAGADSERTRDDQRGRPRARRAARGGRAATGNTMPPLLECVRAYATVGEMCDALREVWGEYEETPTI